MADIGTNTSREKVRLFTKCKIIWFTGLRVWIIFILLHSLLFIYRRHSSGEDGFHKIVPTGYPLYDSRPVKSVDDLMVRSSMGISMR